MKVQELDLTSILRIGDKVYSPICGELNFRGIVDGAVLCLRFDYKSSNLYFTKDGRYSVDGEPLLFPSRDQRDWSKFERPRWRAEKGGKYWVVASDLTSFPSEEKYYSSDNDRHMCGNYFRTREQAEAAADRINELLKQIHDEQD